MKILSQVVARFIKKIWNDQVEAFLVMSWLLAAAIFAAIRVFLL